MHNIFCISTSICYQVKKAYQKYAPIDDSPCLAHLCQKKLSFERLVPNRQNCGCQKSFFGAKEDSKYPLWHADKNM